MRGVSGDTGTERLARRRFYKMTGSGNDFVVFDLRADTGDPSPFESAAVVQRLCARGTGVGADGVVLLTESVSADFRMIYYNSDGSRAAMCGNATLCVTGLVARLGGGHGPEREMSFDSDDGLVRSRVRDGVPMVDLRPVRLVEPDAGIACAPGEMRIGFAAAGVPHLAVLVPDVSAVDVLGRGRELRRHPKVVGGGRGGANVNFLSRSDDAAGWRIRTYERGVEGETLACGTGAVASAVLLAQWGKAISPVRLHPPSGCPLTVWLARSESDDWLPSLQGEGRLVYVGELPTS
jgi:diaminopimelate epimerase